MSLNDLEQAKRNVVAARNRLDSSLVAVQQRLRPGHLAGEAWDGVKGKSADLADEALEAARARPAAVGMALGAFMLFLARAPIKRAVERMIRGDPDEGLIVTQIETDETGFTASAPVADTRIREGVY